MAPAWNRSLPSSSAFCSDARSPRNSSPVASSTHRPASSAGRAATISRAAARIACQARRRCREKDRYRSTDAAQPEARSGRRRPRRSFPQAIRVFARAGRSPLLSGLRSAARRRGVLPTEGGNSSPPTSVAPARLDVPAPSPHLRPCRTIPQPPSRARRRRGFFNGLHTATQAS